MDEKPIQLLGEVYERISAKPLVLGPDEEIVRHSHCEKIDFEYERLGTASIFMFTESLGG